VNDMDLSNLTDEELEDLLLAAHNADPDPAPPIIRSEADVERLRALARARERSPGPPPADPPGAQPRDAARLLAMVREKLKARGES
jgi:hypothetical protein